MRLNRVKVSNYKNIDGITVIFNPDSNYIIGENNLGKSNFLSLLETVFSGGRGFEEKDFTDTTKPVEIELDITLLPSEWGLFGDTFSPEDASMLKIRYHQKINDVYPTIVSTDSNESISTKSLRKIHFLKYETTLVPSRALRLDAQNGAGLLINEIIERFISNGDHAFLNNEQVDGLIGFINTHLVKIRSFRDYAIKATIAPKQTEMLTSLIYLSDGERKIDATGSGVQYMAMASINILCQIMELYKSKATPFEEQLYTNGDGKILLPLVLAIDEPEVHLHPYLQRSLIGYYKKILCNKDPEFAELLKLCFGIDGIDGQLIIVTHSTDALLGDYRNLIRFYRKDVNTDVISGYALQPVASGSNEGRIKSENEKHIIMHFPEIKEAFYAKCAILIEGETEYGCISAFADKIGISLDDFGICVINARGEGSIKPLRHLLKLFAIPSIAIYDGDVMDGAFQPADEFYTNEKCFEIEIVKTLLSNNKYDLVRQIALDLDNKANSHVIDRNFLKDGFKKQGYDETQYTPKKLSELVEGTEEFGVVYAAWFMNKKKKGVLLGRIIGDTLTADLIPVCYADAIIKAKEVAARV